MVNRVEANNYFLLFRTTQSELRAIKSIKYDRKNIIPLIELTKGRISKNDEQGKIKKNIDKISETFKDNTVMLDLSNLKKLSNDEIENLFTANEGYKEWRTFLVDLKKERTFNKIIPVLLQNFEESNYELNFRKQVQLLANDFDIIAYRSNIAEDGCYEDMVLIQDLLKKEGLKFIFLIDCEHVAPGSWLSFADKVSERIEHISEINSKIEFVIFSTSFPKYVGELGDEQSDTFRLHEIDIFNNIKKRHGAKRIYYGDYGSVNPYRSDGIKLKYGWIPRIDVPTSREIFYYRKRRNDISQPYSDVYSYIARNEIVTDSRFPKNLSNNWGIKQILFCADGKAPGSSPSFWISVRMNIHIEQQLRRLKKL